MNPETNRFEPLKELEQSAEEMFSQLTAKLVRPNGFAVPKHWTTFQLGELVVIKNYTFKVAYIGETAILFEPVSPIIGENTDGPGIAGMRIG